MPTIKEIIGLFWSMIDGWLDDPIIAGLCWALVIWQICAYIF